MTREALTPQTDLDLAHEQAIVEDLERTIADNAVSLGLKKVASIFAPKTNPSAPKPVWDLVKIPDERGVKTTYMADKEYEIFQALRTVVRAVKSTHSDKLPPASGNLIWVSYSNPIMGAARLNKDEILDNIYGCLGLHEISKTQEHTQVGDRIHKTIPTPWGVEIREETTAFADSPEALYVRDVLAREKLLDAVPEYQRSIYTEIL